MMLFGNQRIHSTFKQSTISVATMIVGGWFDAEDLYGPLETYKSIEKHNQKITTR